MASAIGLVNSNSFKGIDFVSDDVMCSFKQESGDKFLPDLEMGNDFSKDFQISRMTRCSPGAVYNQTDESSNQYIFSFVEKCMKKHTDDITSILQGISSRLANLELYCYNVDKSVGEISINLGRDYEETDARLKSLDKHLEEVSQSVQILRNKQEFAETQKVLAKRQLGQKGTASPNAFQPNVEQSIHSASLTSDYHETDDTYEVQNQHLAIVLPNQQQEVPKQEMSSTRPDEVAQHVVMPSPVGHQHMAQPQHIYLTPVPYQVQVQPSQGQYVTSDTQHHTPQMLQPNINCVQFQHVPAQVGQVPQPIHHFIQYQQQPQQPQQILSAQVQVQQPPTPVVSRPQSAYGYSPQQHSQSSLYAPRDSVSTSIHLPTPFSSMHHHVVNSGYAILTGYGPVQQLQSQPQLVKENFGAPYGESYKSTGPPHHSLSLATPAYTMHVNEEVKRQPLPQSQFSQGSLQSLMPTQYVSNVNGPRQTQFTHKHAHNDQAGDYSSVHLNVQPSSPHTGRTG